MMSKTLEQNQQGRQWSHAAYRIRSNRNLRPAKLVASGFPQQKDLRIVLGTPSRQRRDACRVTTVERERQDPGASAPAQQRDLQASSRAGHNPGRQPDTR